jgi:hypothetical protein
LDVYEFCNTLQVLMCTFKLAFIVRSPCQMKRIPFVAQLATGLTLG